MDDLPITFACKAFVIHDGALLAIQKSDGDMYFAGQWDLPGGSPEAGETEQEALKRDVWEATGLTIAVGDPFTTTEWLYPEKKPTRRVQIEAYLAVIDAPTAALKEDGEYAGRAKWITFDYLPRTKFIAGLRPLIESFTERFVG